MRTLTKLFLIAITASLLIPHQANAGKIEAVKGKEYFLTKKHGPWMIMVAVFSAPPPELKAEGMGPEEAAQSLVYELRQKGIPAYTFWRKQSLESIKTIDRYQQQVIRKYELDSEICVLAGNYNSPEGKEKLARRTLDWIKKNKPKCFNEDGIYKPTPGQPGPLSGAFLTVNPMLNAEEVKGMQRDPVVINFNSHYEYSLLDNPGKYTVVVASFYGNSVTQLSAQSGRNFNRKLTTGLENAADQAWQVMRVLREQEKMDAYVFHDRKKSIVTVGSFNSASDPRIRQVIKKFTARWETDTRDGTRVMLPRPLKLPSDNGTWFAPFNPVPELMKVPYKK
ncbi:MAG: hypothetical protein JKY95_10915 [Planctomycetaceae bacterium]|nr:hypothetical protein [Planctomycetaceae bacterium]